MSPHEIDVELSRIAIDVERRRIQLNDAMGQNTLSICCEHEGMYRSIDRSRLVAKERRQRIRGTLVAFLSRPF